MKCVLLVFGTRPEAIKMAPVVKELQRFSDEMETVVCVTAQHRQMLDQMLTLFDIRPDIDLDLMQDDQSISSLTAKATFALTEVLADVRPDLILVQGDTTTAMVAALTGYYHRIPVGHIEAGLRTGDLYHPFPEEANRRIISVLATHHFAPTQTAAGGLLQEGVPPERILVTGNTVIDAMFLALQLVKDSELALDTPLGSKKLVLVTVHRRESFGRPLENICWALRRLAEQRPEVQIVYPVHLNPNVYEPVHGILGGHERIHLVEPMEYGQFVLLMSKAYLILTDSGGIQEEAPALGKPVLVLRDKTERPEAVAAGAVKVIGTETDTVLAETQILLDDPSVYHRMSIPQSPYGDGRAAERIVDSIRKAMHQCM